MWPYIRWSEWWDISALIPRERGFFGIKKDKSVLEVPWRSIRKIGNDMIIIEYDGVY